MLNDFFRQRTSMIGEKLSPVLVEIENALWEFEVNLALKPNYSTEGFRAAVKIFMSVMLDKMWELQENEDIPQADREQMALTCGKETRELVKRFTDIDTHTLYI